MFRITMIAALAATTIATAAAPSFAQSASDDARFQAAQDRFSRELSIYQQEFDRYQRARSNGYRGGGGYYAPPPPPSSGGYYDSGDRNENGYDPSRYYRSGDYQERTLSSDDRVYRGSDGRYYCKRSDGTTGLILGAGAGGVLGNVIDGGHSRVVGTLLGAAVGAVAGKAIDQNSSQVRCR